MEGNSNDINGAKFEVEFSKFNMLWSLSAVKSIECVDLISKSLAIKMRQSYNLLNTITLADINKIAYDSAKESYCPAFRNGLAKLFNKISIEISENK